MLPAGVLAEVEGGKRGEMGWNGMGEEGQVDAGDGAGREGVEHGKDSACLFQPLCYFAQMTHSGEGAVWG